MEHRNSNPLYANSRQLQALPAVVQRVAESATHALLHSFEQVLVECDDRYFSLAERAGSNAEQALFFESLRTLRLQKDRILVRFGNELTSVFTALAAVPPEVSEYAQQECSAEALSLVDTTELEKTVALSNIISRARNQASEQLYFLNKRLDTLFQHIDVDENANPLDPAQLGKAFAAAIEPVQLGGKARDVLCKQFERMLAAKLADFCAAANQQLVDAGVLPTITRRAADSAIHRQAAQTVPATDTTAADFEQISRLFANLRDHPMPQEQNVPAFFSSGSGQPLIGEQLISLVAQMQANAGEPTSLPVDIRQLFRELISKQQAQGKDVCLATPDEDVINLVAMFFDFVLEDRQLSAQAQALIGRLQFPVLKLALRDKAFFSNSRHPARQLINELVDASIGMNEGEAEANNALQQHLAASVQAIIHEETNEDSFVRALAELKQFRAIEESKAAKIEKRTCDSAQAQATTDQARIASKALIFQRLKQEIVPEVLQDFLVNDWQQVLFLTRLRYGERSPEEDEVEQTMDDLIWASVQHVDAKSQQRLRRLLPDLQARLRRWLELATPSQDSIEQSLQPLLELHAQLLQPEASAAISRGKLAAHQAKALQPSGEHKSWSEMTTQEREQVEYKDLSYGFIQQVENYPLGTWFDIKQEGATLRCKLAARVTASDSYIFVNRLGFKVLALHRKAFAYDIQRQLANPVQSEPFFERTLGKVVRQLQQLADSVTQAAQHSQA